jgi:hypothetical protein
MNHAILSRNSHGFALRFDCENISAQFMPADVRRPDENTIEIDCSPELSMGLNLDAKQFGDLSKLRSATALFGEGRLFSGMTARWCGMIRVHFRMRALRSAGATLLDDTEDDLARETALL